MGPYGFSFVRRPLGMLALAIALAGCTAAPNIGGPPGGSPTASNSATFGWHGAVLEAGQRTAIVADGYGWVVSMVPSSGSLLLTRLSLDTGDTKTTTLASGVATFAGAGVASDGSGNLWIAYGLTVMRVDEASGGSSVWPLPNPATAAALADDPTRGWLVAAAWDPASNRLVLARNGDSSLYAFDPAAGAAATIATLPIVTGARSAIAIAADGSIGVNGVLAGVDDPRSAAVWFGPGRPVQQLADAVSLCLRHDVLTYLTGGGSVTTATGGIAAVTATIVAPRTSRPPVACDDAGHFFAVTGGDGQIVVDRIDDQGRVSAMVGNLTPTKVTHLGVTRDTWWDPGIVGLIPDGTGGVWLVSEGGSQAAAGSAVYPSLVHGTFGAASSAPS